MALFKCKMCGGTLEINNSETVGTCEYCGTQQTLPKLNDDRRVNRYDRANHFRRNNEYDKAMSIYEQILNEDDTDAEAYWSLVLCRYGIEYVEDPASHKRIPTVNRAQFTSVFDDDNYKSALRYATDAQRTLYEAEAKAINEIQKGILAISQKEEPFDVFICYKETDNNGRRTPDSVLAQELYYLLTQEGFKVFFSRITLEDKLGSAYEPYIFAALNSAKLMVVLGTRPEYFRAVWVQNEWSRYLALIKQGQNKMLIPAFKDMDPYDLPEEFSHLQAQDMSKLGFMQDLIRGIKKIIRVESPKAAVVKETVVSTDNTNSNTSTNIAPLLERAFMFLEDGDWTAADEYCERVLDADPKNATAYLGKLMADLRVKYQESLKDQKVPFDDNNNYRKALRFADETLKTTLTSYIDHINTRNESERLTGIYTRATQEMSAASSEAAFKSAACLFDSISQYRDSAELAKECFEKAEITRNDTLLADGKSKMARGTIESCEAAIKSFQIISGWKDADNFLAACQKRIDELNAADEERRLEEERQAALAKEEAERDAKRRKIVCKVLLAIAAAAIIFVVVLNAVIIPNSKYNDAIALMEAENYDEAYSIFVELGDYKDATKKANDLKLLIIKNAKVGDYYITLGSYEQDNNTSNGQEDIEWLVLDIKDGKALVISKYALDCKSYNTIYTDVTWENCTLRTWLNNDFLNAAFSADEKAMIPTVTVSADKNPDYDTDPGNATQDQVFLLSIAEANAYFGSDNAGSCKPTAYADANGAYTASGYCWWWLRSPGCSQRGAADVDPYSYVDDIGLTVDGRITGVRPAMWIDLEASSLLYKIP